MASSRIALPEGLLLGEYEIQKILGAGGFGITYLARDPALKRLFAVKEYCPYELSTRERLSVRPHAETQDEYERGLADFLKEAQTLARFHHRNIVGVARIFEANNTAYMVLNFEEGQSLKEWLRDRDTRPSQQDLDRIVAQLLDALAVIHADDTLHRDIAPDNIYIRKDGSPVLLDFGSARQALVMRSRSVSAIVKAGYSPQEQYSTRAANQGPWTDIYALAATLYRAITGETPPEASDRTIEDTLKPLAAQGLGNYRPSFLAAVDWALELRPKDRPQSVSDWRPPLLDNQKVPMRSKGAAAGTPAREPRSRVRTVTTAAAILLAAGGSVGSTAFYFQDRIASLTADAETQIAALRNEAEMAVRRSDETRGELERTRIASSKELASLRSQIEGSKSRSSELSEKLARAQKNAAGASAADREKLAGEVDELERLIDQERIRAADLEEAERASRDALSAEIAALEQRLGEELATKTKAIEETEFLRRQASDSSIEFVGLELAPANPDRSHIVRGVKLDSWFRGKVKETEVLQAISLNGQRVDLADDSVRRASEESIMACDTLVAQLADDEGPRSVDILVPADFQRGSGVGALTRIDSLGIEVASEGMSYRPLVIKVEAGSPAANAGLRAGDEITAFSATTVTSGGMLADLADEAARKGGAPDIDYLRDCAKLRGIVDLKQPPIEVEWGGLVFAGFTNAPPRLERISAQGALTRTGLEAGDEVRAFVLAGKWVEVKTLEEAKERFAAATPCGTMRIHYRRNGKELTTYLTVAQPVRASEQRLELTELGLSGWELADGGGFQVSLDGEGLNNGRRVPVQTRDIIKQLGDVEGADIADMTAAEQLALLQTGGQLVIERSCALVETAVPRWDPLNEPVDLRTLSAAERRAIIKALYAMEHYTLQEAPREFVEDGANTAATRRAVRSFKASRGEIGSDELTRRDINYLVPLGREDLPGDKEQQILREFLPPAVASDSELYRNRIRLFLISQGYGGAGIRNELSRFLQSRGNVSANGYVTSLPLARQIFTETIRLQLQPPPEKETFGEWVFAELGEWCEIFSRPVEIEGYLFNYRFAGDRDDHPIIYMAVGKNPSTNAMSMNFGGDDSYDPTAPVSAFADDGTRYSIFKDDGSFKPEKSGAGVSDELHKALRNGQWLEINGPSAFGGNLRIRYSAVGFTAAFNHMMSECNAWKLSDWFD